MDSMIPTTVPAVIGSNSEDPATAAIVSNSDSTPDPATISTMYPRMYFAAKRGDVGILESNCKCCSPVSLSSFLTPEKNTILHIAIRFHQVEFAEKILKTEPSLLVQANTKGDTPLHVAMISEHMTTIELLTRCYKEREEQQDPESRFSEWRAANSEGNTALHLSLISRNPKVALKLLSAYRGYANCVNNAQESPLYLAASFGYVDVVRTLLSIDDVSLMGPNCQTPLHAAAAMFARTKTQKNDTEAIARLLCKKVPHIIRQRDDFGRTALHYSAATPTAKGITHILLRSDRMLAYIPDKDGHTPLLIAVLLKNWNTINIILRYCPDCGEICDSSGQNAFHLVMREKLNILRILAHPELKHLLNGKDDEGNTPFHLAASAGYYVGVCRLLQQKGVDFVAMNKSGRTVLDYADTWECITLESNHVRNNLINNGVVRRASKIGQKANIPSARPIKELKQLANTLLVVATLLTTITFAAVFQVPGGYSSDHPGIALFAKKIAFQTFLLSDCSLFFISMLCIFFLTWGLTTGNRNLRKALGNVFPLFGLAVYMSTITFVTAVYLIVEEIKWLAISIIVMGCFSTISIIFKHKIGGILWVFPGFHNPRVSNHRYGVAYL